MILSMRNISLHNYEFGNISFPCKNRKKSKIKAIYEIVM